jgi:uncharacterized RDD family membrane protein YckC
VGLPLAAPPGATRPASRGIVTPEAVVLEFDTAGVASRGVARVIDSVVVLFGFSSLFGVAVPVFGGDITAVLIAGIVVSILAVYGYPCFCETMWGRTLGHSILGLRVVTEEGGPVRFRHAAIRAFMQTVDLFLVPVGVVGVISMLAGQREQRLGDRLAGTIVIRSAVTTNQSRAIAFPPLPGYEQYVQSLDTGGLSTEAYEVLRSFLTRVTELTPGARQHLASRLVGPIAAAIGQSPPATMAPEIFLDSVAAAYQLRHGGPATRMWGPTPSVPPMRRA